ncbi:hypothetical protein MNBD_GAMMA08-2159 [hydrothermal vent metagenome]|uniref:Uncharacterized protein n=1 Tax=hydrothermal vent metagenome TaxID=652676 RepID=A0A3B0XQR6_9ZZZZ
MHLLTPTCLELSHHLNQASENDKTQGKMQLEDIILGKHFEQTTNKGDG